MRDKIFFYSLFSFLMGVFLRSFLVFPDYLLWAFGSISLFFGCLYLFKKHSNFVIISCSFLFLLLGILRFHTYDESKPKNIFDEYVGEEITFKGIIEDEPDRRENNQRLVVQEGDIKILVSTELYPEFLYGDEVSVTGTLQKPKNFTTDIGKDFNYIDYLGKDSIYYTISFADVEHVSSRNGNAIKSFLFKIKGKFLKNIESIVKEPESSLLSGLLLGVKSSLGEDLKQSFINTGLVHIIVLSGYNVTIIAEAIMRSLYFLPFAAATGLGIFSIILFALMAGGGSTIVRASIMAIIALVARKTGNQYSIVRALAIAGFLMVLQNPYILYFDLSFQLSFIATLGLIYMAPIFENIFKFLPTKFGLREIAGATIGTQLFVLPFILYKMGTLSIIAPISNILVLPMIPMTMFFGFLTGLLAFMSRFLALPFGFITQKLLSLEIFLVEFFSDLQFSHVEVRNFSAFFVVIIYVLIGFLIYRHQTSNHEKGRHN